jgi:ABC-type dipeptide/oligopeptide/nickel transport system ATPase component
LSARLLSDEILVLNKGKVVEQGPAKQIIRQPKDEYTRLLLDAIPKLEYASDGPLIHNPTHVQPLTGSDQVVTP